jgi:hypothetical protein
MKYAALIAVVAIAFTLGKWAASEQCLTAGSFYFAGNTFVCTKGKP